VLDLDRVLLMVAGDPWQKSGGRTITAAADRLEMTRAAASGIEGLEVSDLEVERGGSSYMVDTMIELHARFPDVGLDLIVGADAAAGLHTWHRPEDLAALCRVVVVDRAGDALASLPEGFDLVRVSIPRLDVSSSELRDRVSHGRPIVPLTTPGVCTVIEGRRLYR